jgi:Ca2+-binding RTX toxin-like protein
MLETNGSFYGKLDLSNIVSALGFANPLPIAAPPLKPENNPFYIPGVFDLNFDPAIGDSVILTTGLLRNYSLGLRALAGDDYIVGSSDSELMNGNAGSDLLVTQGGSDIVLGGQDTDYIDGGDGNDRLNGNKGDDFVYGEGGNDRVNGGQGNDNLVGGAGQDILTGDLGIDKLWGGTEADTFNLRKDDAAPPQTIGTPQPQPFTGAVDTVPADIILDYNAAEGDVIGLPQGLSASDVLLVERFLIVGDARDFDRRGPYPPGGIRTADFQVVSIQATVIQEASTGNILGLVRDTAPSALRFVLSEDCGCGG